MNAALELEKKKILGAFEEFGAKLDEVMAAIPVREVSQLAKRLEGRRRAPAGSDATKLLR